MITLDKAAVWVDGRYYKQAETEIDCNWIMMKYGECERELCDYRGYSLGGTQWSVYCFFKQNLLKTFAEKSDPVQLFRCP